MMYPQDWKNVEGYAFYRINRWSDSTRNGRAHIEFVLRGGHSTNQTTLVGGFAQKCEASSYHFNFYTTGRATFERDNMHSEGYTKDVTVHEPRGTLIQATIAFRASASALFWPPHRRRAMRPVKRHLP
jgi:hypothetical protein